MEMIAITPRWPVYDPLIRTITKSHIGSTVEAVEFQKKHFDPPKFYV